MKNKLFSHLPAGAALALTVILIPGSALADPQRKLDLDPTPPIREGALAGYSAIVDKVAPSVVSVYSSKMVASQPGGQYYFYDPSTGRLHPGRQAPQQLEAQPQGLGSGVIVTSDGYIVTNRHVIKGADEVKVTLGKRSEPYEAKIVGMDEATDVAVLKIEATGLQPVQLADSSTLKVGDFTLAIGSPFGLRHTVTTGIVSALERSELGLIGESGYENFIQTDASINPGNSGGALVDNRGRMIGINTAIFSRSGGNVGIGFAIPTDLATGVVEQLIEHGEVQRGFLGIRLGDLTPELAEAMSSGRDGSIVHEVVEGSPAEEAQLQPGDVITRFAGKMVTSAAKLRLLVGSTRPGSEVEFQIVREGKEQTLRGVIGGEGGLRNASMTIPRAKPMRGDKAQSAEFLAGVGIAELTNSLRSRLGVPRDIQGIVIESVEPSSAASEAGLVPGEIITEVARQPVQSYDDAVDAKASSRSDVLLLRVLGANGARFVAVDISA